MAFRSLPASRFLSSAQRLGAGGVGSLRPLGATFFGFIMKTTMILFSLMAIGCSKTDTEPAPARGSMVIEKHFSQVVVRFQPPAPLYPEGAKATHIQGTVVVELIIDPDGIPSRATTLSGPVELAPTSESYAMTWRFAPTLIKGVPQFTKTQIIFPFKLPR
ncbi:energy transducer TonB [Geothrix oryzisoli]|uniref:energy transducer TonB n=1 Tax=Geothrix oryzisoli TaxID=2922721 RepID=UPI003B846722